MPEILQTFMQQASAKGARSTVLHTLLIFIGMLLSAIVVTATIGAPEWIINVFTVVFSFACGIFFLAFIYFGLNDPDALRSEKFVIDKMAMEKGLYGDSQSGLHQANVIEGEAEQQKTLTSDQGDDQ